MDASSNEPDPSNPSPTTPPLATDTTAETPRATHLTQLEQSQTDGAQQDQPGQPESQKQTAHPGRIQISPEAGLAGQPSQQPSRSSSLRNSVATPGPFSSWSASSDKQLGHMSAGSDMSGDRVFPIRSVISFDPTTTKTVSEEDNPGGNDAQLRKIPVSRPSHQRGEPSTDLRRTDTGPLSPKSSSSREKGLFPRRSTLSGGFGGRGQDNPRFASSGPLRLELATSDKDTDESGALGDAEGPMRSGVSTSSANGSEAEPPLVSTRFTHVETEDGHSVITGRDGTLQRCEDEPIHTPGAVQGFGALLALREESDGCFVVRYVSENSERLLGYSPKHLFRLKNFMDILTEEQQDNLLDHIDFIRDDEADPAGGGPEVFSLSIRPPKRRSLKLWCAIHINEAHSDLIICEFELDDDQQFPLRPPDEKTPDEPHDTLQANPTTEELEASTEVLSKPLRILRSARKRRGEQGAMQVFDIMSQVQEQLSAAENLDSFLKILIGIVKELTGFHRVMIYQFDSSFNGKVVSELVDPNMTRDLYHGLNFPASDIPRQARDLYKLNKVRLLYDRDLETARIVCRTKEDLDLPLDMSHAYLRAMSPIHLKYLGNMAVRSSMSISVNAFNELWGLIACHSYGNHGMRVSFPIRKMCRLVGDTASRNIERLSYASRLQARKLINTAPTDKNPSGYIIASSDDLLRLFDADFGLLSIKGETKILGTIDHSQEALAMLEYLRMRGLTSVVASQDIIADFPDLRYPPGFQVIAGLLYVPLSVGGSDFIVFFRRGQVKEVKWAGNPYEKIIRDGTAGYLEPRTSFKTWYEKVIGKCREWNEEQIETAAVLCLVYGKFIEVWRQKEQALQNSKLTRLLLANSAHEVRTPLNAIINYLEIALEGSLDSETRENLARSHSASKSLIYVINDLLDLTKTEEGQSLIKDEIFDLPACVKEATDPFINDTARKGLDYSVVMHSGLPQFAHGDSRRVRQTISNVTANAVAHTVEGFVRVEVLVSELRDNNQAVIDFVISDSGTGMSVVRLDSLFRDLEQVSTEAEDPEVDGSKPPAEARTLGLGLAVVARTVRNMDGQLRLKSDEGLGSRFVIQLPFNLPSESPATADEGSTQAASVGQKSNQASMAPVEMTAAPEGEMMLVDRGSAINVSTEPERATSLLKSEKGSAEVTSRKSMESANSYGSHQSDADRLINAIQTPLSLNDQEPTWPLSRQNSKGSKGSSVGSKTKSSNTAEVSLGSPRSRRRLSSPSQQRQEPGTSVVRDSKVPIRPVKVPDDYTDIPPRPQAGERSGVVFELPNETRSRANTESVTSGTTGGDQAPLQVLVAEDDPINMKILRKRLERCGHEVHHTVNGEDCATTYKEQSKKFDIILMDMQMPIVDGLTSTEMIRKVEGSPEHQGHSALAESNGRIPIFAVSASLLEREKEKYVDAGFDGWILKPIDFKRLNTLLSGIGDDEVRRSCLYEPGEWERGGWFTEREAVPATAPSTEEDTTPTGKNENRDSLAAAGVQVVDKAAEHAEESSAEQPTSSATSAEPST